MDPTQPNPWVNQPMDNSETELDDYCDKLVDERRVSTIDIPKRNFQSPEFGTKMQRGVPLFLEIAEFPVNTV